MSICMRVPVSSSIRVNGLQNVRPPATAGIGNVQRIDRSNDNVTASVSETTEDAQNNPFGNIVVLENVGFAYNDIIARSNEARNWPAHFLHRCNVMEVTADPNACINAQNNLHGCDLQVKALPG